MAKPRLKLVTPATVKRTVMPKRRPNAELRRREHLTVKQLDWSETQIRDFVATRKSGNPHLCTAVGIEKGPP
jgi:hypothetical protein